MFTLQPDSMPGALLFSDGRRHAFNTYQSANPKTVRAMGACSSLCWHGTIPSLTKLHAHYRRIASALGALCAPEYAHRYVGREQICINFGSGVGASSDSGAANIVTLDVYSENGSSAGEIKALFRRRKRDWGMVTISSEREHDLIRPPYLLLRADRVISHDLEFAVSVPCAGFPAETLADLIESTSPRSYIFESVPTGDGKSEFQIRHEPWPLSRKELMAALEQVENEWFPPLRVADTD